jgi:nucleoside-diphosphate-sugar epimerase
MILVTGGTGLVGSHLINALIQQNKSVRALYNTSNPPQNLKNVEWIQTDILDIIALVQAMQNVKQVYHCAALVSFNPKKRNELFKINVEGTTNVINTCIDAAVEKILFVSSVAALGKISGNKIIDETIAWSKTNTSEYGKSKHLAETEVWRGIGEGLPAVIVNPAIILGAGDWNNGSTKIFKSSYNEFPWYTEGVNGFVDVHDVVKAMLLLMDSDISAQRFILCAENISYKKLFDEIALNFNKKVPHKKVTPLLAETIWRLESIKANVNNNDPLLTKETARTAQEKVYYNNSKLLKYLPAFSYKAIEQSIKNICDELKLKYSL